MRALLSFALMGLALPACAQTVRTVPALAPAITVAPLAGRSAAGASFSPQLSPSLSLPAPALGLGPSSVLTHSPTPALSAQTPVAPAAGAQAHGFAGNRAAAAAVSAQAPEPAAQAKALEPEALGEILWRALETLPSASAQLAFAREKGIRLEVVSFAAGRAEGLDPDNLAQFEPEGGVLRLNLDMVRSDMAALRGTGATEARVSELMGLALAPVLAHELRHAKLRADFGSDFPGLKEEEILTHADQARAFDEALRLRPELARLETFILRHQREIWSKWKEGFGSLARFVLRKYESAPSLDGEALRGNAAAAKAQREKLLAMGEGVPASWLSRIEAAIRLWEDPAAVKKLVDFMQARVDEEVSRGAGLASSVRSRGRGLGVAGRADASASLSSLKGLAGRGRAAAAADAQSLQSAFDGASAALSADASVSAAKAAKKTRPGERVRLDEIDTEDTGKFDKDEKDKALKRLAEDQARLDELQQMLYAQREKSVLIVLQGMDTSGKDGTIRHVLAAMTPQGFKVVSFKKPTEEESRHHYLWRIKNALPEKGFIGVFNRSHYEDILVPSVYKTLPAAEVEARFAQINAFEKKLADSGVTVVKFFLHISKDEQRERLQERLDNPDKQWKFSPEDLKSRARWDDFQRTYEKILERTDTPWAPWHIIPADKKWYRNYLVGRILRETMEKMDLAFPKPAEGLDKVVIPE